MTSRQIIEIATRPNLVAAVEGIESVMAEGRVAQRLIATAAVLHLRHQEGFVERILSEASKEEV